jgi:hypothetical protein
LSPAYKFPYDLPVNYQAVNYQAVNYLAVGYQAVRPPSTIISVPVT